MQRWSIDHGLDCSYYGEFLFFMWSPILPLVIEFIGTLLRKRSSESLSKMLAAVIECMNINASPQRSTHTNINFTTSQRRSWYHSPLKLVTNGNTTARQMRRRRAEETFADNRNQIGLLCRIFFTVEEVGDEVETTVRIWSRCVWDRKEQNKIKLMDPKWRDNKSEEEGLHWNLSILK